MVCVLLATGSANAQPAIETSPDTGAAVAPGAQPSLPFSERRARWLGVVNAIDAKKFGRIWQCMQFLGATEFLEAVNICAPCVSAAPTGAARDTVALGAAERQCINRRKNAGRGGDAGSGRYGNDELQSTLHPQCSGVSSHGPQADANSDNARRERELRRALERATDRATAAYQHVQDARRWVRDEEAAESAARRELAETDNDDNYERQQAAQRALEGARLELRDAEREYARAEREVRAISEQINRLEAQRRESERSVVDRVIDWVRAHLDPTVDPTGTDSRGGYEDPRCQGKRQAAAWGAMWSDVCRGEDGHLVDMKECHRRMTDPVYAATGGRCWMAPDPADRTRVVCRDDQARGQNPGSTPGDAGNQGFVDPTPWSRPNRRSAGIGPVPNPVQPFVDSMCAKGRCPDPLPFNSGALPRGSNANSRWSAPAPPGQTQIGCPAGTKKRGQACVATRTPQQMPTIRPIRTRQQLWQGSSTRARTFKQIAPSSRGSYGRRAATR